MNIKLYLKYVVINIVILIGVFSLQGCTKKSTNLNISNYEMLPKQTTQSTSFQTQTTAASSTTRKTAKHIQIFAGDIPQKYFSVKKEDLTPTEPLIEDKTEDHYTDADGVKYYFDKQTGNYCGFRISSGIAQGTKDSIPQTKLETLSDTIAEKFIKVKQYQRTYQYKEGVKTHWFTYDKYKNGIKTADKFLVWINADGNIKMARALHTGEFDNIKIPEIDHEKLEQQARQRVEEKGYVFQQIREKELVFENGKLCIRCACDAVTKGMETAYEVLEYLTFELE